MDKLIYDKIIMLRYARSRTLIKRFPPSEHSPLLCEFLIDMVENCDISYNLLDKLNSDDILYFEDIMRYARLTEPLKYNKRIDKEALKKEYRNRLTVLQGSYGAGNDISSIRPEAIDLVHKLYELNDLNRGEYHALVRSLK